MATYSNNVTQKIAAAIFASGNTSGAVNVYTVPAESFAMLNVSFNLQVLGSSNNVYLRVGGIEIGSIRMSSSESGHFAGSLYTDNYRNTTSSQTGSVYSFGPMWFGPGQVVSINANGHNVSWRACGVQFINTP